jgi:hypothetical protein
MFQPKCHQCAGLLAERNAAVDKQINDAKALYPLRAELGNLRRKIKEQAQELSYLRKLIKGESLGPGPSAG